MRNKLFLLPFVLIFSSCGTNVDSYEQVEKRFHVSKNEWYQTNLVISDTTHYLFFNSNNDLLQYKNALENAELFEYGYEVKSKQMDLSVYSDSYFNEYALFYVRYSYGNSSINHVPVEYSIKENKLE